MQTLPKNRLLSLDVFRGITIAGMILVNNPGSWSHVYAPLRHAEWHGWTPTDFIFPFFLFIVGVAIAHHGLRYNCAAVVAGGEVIGLTPKEKLPTYNVFYEGRTFAFGSSQRGPPTAPTTSA